jgi:hypothetical protein
MVGEQHPVVRLDIAPHGVRQFSRRRRAVLRDRNAAERRDDLGENGPGEGDARHGKAGGSRWMRVHDGPGVRTLTIDLDVHRQFWSRRPTPSFR